MKWVRISPFLLLFALLLWNQNEESSALNLFLSPQQAHAFVVTEDKSSSSSDPLATTTTTTTEEIGVPVRPGEVEKEIQEEFIEDQADPQEAALETEERSREKTEL